MSAAPQPTFVVEYPCDRHCRVEVDLAGVHMRFTLKQMIEKADREHKRVHEPPPGVMLEPTPVHDRLAATFSSE